MEEKTTLYTEGHFSIKKYDWNWYYIACNMCGLRRSVVWHNAECDHSFTSYDDQPASIVSKKLIKIFNMLIYMKNL